MSDPFVEQLVIESRETNQRLAEMTSTIVTLSRDLTRLAEASDAATKVIRGYNGTPGLVAEVKSITDWIKTHECGADEREKILKGDSHNAGLLEQVRRHESILATYKYWVYLVVGAIVLGLIDLFTTILPELIKLRGG